MPNAIKLFIFLSFFAFLAFIYILLYNPRGDEEIARWNFEVGDSHIWQPRGELFTANFGDVICGGGFVFSVQSRAFVNSNDIEFWCRETSMELSFYDIGRGRPDSFSTQISNLSGELYDYASGLQYDFEEERWVASSISQDPFPYIIQPISGQIYVFSPYNTDCEGMSLYLDGSYIGTIPLDVSGESFSAFSIWGDTIYANIFSMRVAHLPTRPSEACHYMPTTEIETEQIWAYGTFPVGNSVLFGGNYGGYGIQSDRCASFFQFSEGITNEIPVILGGEVCDGGEIKEYYAYTISGERVLIGNFPLGTILELNEGAVVNTEIAAPRPDDFLDAVGTRYRESQALVASYGAVFVGMYPWGELIVSDRVTGEETAHRLITTPTRDESPAPYFDIVYQRVLQRDGVISDPNAELVYSLTRNNRSLRDEGLEPTHWAQRIPSIAIFSGRLCASTGNLSGAGFNPSLHYDIDYSDYGNIYCAILENHVMSPWRPGEIYSFTLTTRHLIIEIDGVVVAQNAHSLSASQLAAIEVLFSTDN